MGLVIVIVVGMAVSWLVGGHVGEALMLLAGRPLLVVTLTVLL